MKTKTLRHAGIVYTIHLDLTDLEDVGVEITGPELHVRGIYGYGLTLSTHSPAGALISITEDLHDAIEDGCEIVINEARFLADEDEEDA